MNRIFGLVGFPLSHSFSKDYFSRKFRVAGIRDAVYENFELKKIDEINSLLNSNPAICGLNVTIPYKESVISFMHELSPDARRVGAVNVIKRMPDGKLKGYNSDYYGFRTSLEKWMGRNLADASAIILGTGGAAKAVTAVLEDCNIMYRKVSRKPGKEELSYFDLRNDRSIVSGHNLIVNTTPLGMFPKINEMPNLPYEWLDKKHFLYDLIYNPDKTLFLQKGESAGCQIKNGKEMLELQAERSWQIWTNN